MGSYNQCYMMHGHPPCRLHHHGSHHLNMQLHLTLNQKNLLIHLANITDLQQATTEAASTLLTLSRAKATKHVVHAVFDFPGMVGNAIIDNTLIDKRSAKKAKHTH